MPPPWSGIEYLKLTPKQRDHLKGQAHGLDPLIHMGKNGLTNEVITHIDKALTDHELIKIKFLALKEEKQQLTATIIEKTGGELIEIIGNIAIIYRQNEEKLKRKVTLS
jgi:RNA-binding protein